MSGQPITGSKYFHIAAVNTGTIKSGAGSLFSVCVNTKVASAVLTLYDAVNPGGTVIAVIDCSGGTESILYLTDFANGLSYALAGGNADITVSYS